MITWLAQGIADFLRKNGTIRNEELAVYIYGFEIFISNMICVCIVIFFGIAFSQIVESIIFFIVFSSMRKFCGGYHANTYLRCNTLFAVTLGSVMLLLRVSSGISVVAHVVLILFCTIAIVAFAPIEHINKPIPENKKTKHKVKALILGSVFMFLSSLLFTSYNQYSFDIDLAMLVVVISMIIVKHTEGQVSQ